MPAVYTYTPTLYAKNCEGSIRLLHDKKIVDIHSIELASFTESSHLAGVPKVPIKLMHSSRVHLTLVLCLCVNYANSPAW